MKRPDLIRLVARRAAERADELSPADRADLFDGIALIVGGKQAAQAREAAFTLREAERCQLNFLQELLQ